MERIVLAAHAKINLALDITGRRADGLHELDTIMQSVSLADEVELVKAPGTDIAVRCEGAVSGGVLPQGERNIAYRAARAYFQAAGFPAEGVSISIRKRIPTQAGLGGGSADAAAVLEGMARLFPAELSPEELLKAGVLVGADVPFCLTGGCLRARGIGERLSPLPPLPDCAVLIAKPEGGVSTAAAYAAYDRQETHGAPHTGALCAVLEEGRLGKVGARMGNVFAEVLPLSAVERLCADLRSAGAAGSCMSGSGSAVFGLFADEPSARSAAAAFSDEQAEAFFCRPVEKGWMIRSFV